MARGPLIGMAAVLVIGSCAAPDRKTPFAEGVVRDAAWESVLTGGEGLTGGDGGASVLIPGGRVLWTLGDSLVGRVVEGRHGPGTAMVNNAMVVHDLQRPPDRPPPQASIKRMFGPDPRPGMHSAWLMPNGQAAPVENASAWYWPTGGAIVTGRGSDRPRLSLFYTRLTRRGGEAEGTVWNFHAQRSVLAVVENPGDQPAAWRVSQHDLGPIERDGRRINWGVAAVEADGLVYIFGIDDTVNLSKRAALARVEGDRITDPQHWRFWTGRDWSPDRNEAASICERVTDELSIHCESGRWVMIHMEPNLGRRIMFRTAPELAGPWSDPRVVYECPEPAEANHLMVYAARAHPELSPEGSGDLIVTYAVNSTDFWHMLAHADLYRIRFLRVPASFLAGP